MKGCCPILIVSAGKLPKFVMNTDAFYINQRIPMKESDISRSIQIALTREGARVFRNNVGLFETRDGRAIQTGLCVGSSDLIGWTKSGRFLAVEVKIKKGRATLNQQNFLQQVNNCGGVGIIVRSVEDAVQQYRERTK